MLKLCLFGQPQIRWLESSYTVPRRQTRALLFTLATHLQPIKRQRLNILFWPDAPESIARRKVSRLISDLRNALPDPNLLLATEDQVWLQTHGIQSDTVGFTSNIARQTLSTLTSAVELCDAPFLQDFRLTNRPEYDAWMEEERHSFDLLKASCLETLIQLYSELPLLDKDANHAVIKYAKQLVALDPLMESAQYALMMRLYETGQRDSALNQYQRYREHLLRNDEGEPSMTIRRLFSRIINSPILGQTPTTKSPSTKSPSNHALFDAEHRTASSAKSRKFHGKADYSEPKSRGLSQSEQFIKLFGRDAELAKLNQLYEQASKKNGSICLISGESGIGKTALVSAVLQQRLQTTHAAQGSAYPGSQTLPYALLLAAFRSAISDEAFAMRIFSKLAPHVQSNLSTLFPEFHRLNQTHHSALSSSVPQTQTEQFEAIGQLLFTIAEEHSCFILLLENIHWCDETSLAWLAYIGNRVAESNILVIVTLGDNNNRISLSGHSSAHTLHGGLDQLQFSLNRCGVLYKMELPALTHDEIRGLVSSQPNRTSWSMSQSWIFQLHKMSAGNPELLLIILEILEQRGCRDQESIDWQSVAKAEPITNKVRELFLLLSAEARHFINMVAISGPTCSIDQIQSNLDISDKKVVSIISELLVNHLLTCNHAQLKFRHGILRLAVIESIHPLQRSMLQKSVHNGHLL